MIIYDLLPIKGTRNSYWYNPPKKGGTWNWKKLVVPAIDEKYPKVGPYEVGPSIRDREINGVKWGPYKWPKIHG